MAAANSVLFHFIFLCVFLLLCLVVCFVVSDFILASGRLASQLTAHGKEEEAQAAKHAEGRRFRNSDSVKRHVAIREGRAMVPTRLSAPPPARLYS